MERQIGRPRPAARSGPGRRDAVCAALKVIPELNVAATPGEAIMNFRRVIGCPMLIIYEVLQTLGRLEQRNHAG